MNIRGTYNLVLNIPIMNTFSMDGAVLINKLTLRQLEGLNEFYVFMDNYVGSDPDGDMYYIFLFNDIEHIIPKSYIAHGPTKEVIKFRRRSSIVTVFNKIGKPFGYKLVKR